MKFCETCYYARDWVCNCKKKEKYVECYLHINEPNGKPFDTNKKSTCPKYKAKK